MQQHPVENKIKNKRNEETRAGAVGGCRNYARKKEESRCKEGEAEASKAKKDLFCPSLLFLFLQYEPVVILVGYKGDAVLVELLEDESKGRNKEAS